MEPIEWFMLASAIITVVTNIGLSERQRNYDEQMMDKQNEYNLPENQMKRLEDAGINPASFGMGQGMTISGNTSASNNGYQLPNILDPMTMMSNSFLSHMSGSEAKEKAITEKDSREVRIEELHKKIEKYQFEIEQLGVDTKAQQIANDYAAIFNELAVEKEQQVINLTRNQAENVASLTDKYRFEFEKILPEQLKGMIEERKLNVLNQQEVVAEIKRIYADTAYKDAQTGLAKQQTETEYRTQSLISQESALTEEQVNMLRHSIQQYLDTYEDVVTKISNEAKLSTREVKAFWIKLILNGVDDAGSLAGNVGLLLKFLPK